MLDKIKEQIQRYSSLLWLIEHNKFSLNKISAEIEKHIFSISENERPYYLQNLFLAKQGWFQKTRRGLYLAARSGVEKDGCGNGYYNHYGLRLTFEEAEDFFKTLENSTKPPRNIQILDDCESLAIEIFKLHNQL